LSDGESVGVVGWWSWCGWVVCSNYVSIWEK